MPEWRGSTIIPPLRPLEREKAEKEMRLALERTEEMLSMEKWGNLTHGMWEGKLPGPASEAAYGRKTETPTENTRIV